MAAIWQGPAFPNANMGAVVQTPTGENLRVESNFHEHLDGADFPSRLGIAGEGWIDGCDPRHPVDAGHLELRRRCIDGSFPLFDPKPRATMFLEPIRTRLGSWHRRQRQGHRGAAGPHCDGVPRSVRHSRPVEDASGLPGRLSLGA